jgi:hypothetical protein
MSHLGDGNTSAAPDHSDAHYSLIVPDEYEGHRHSVPNQAKDVISTTTLEVASGRPSPIPSDEHHGPVSPLEPVHSLDRHFQVPQPPEGVATVSKWGVGWKTPALMYGSYLFGKLIHPHEEENQIINCEF